METTNTESPHHRNSTQVEAAILEAARDLLADGGVNALSMRHVADRVGVTATAIYHYFDGKQEIVDRVVLGAFEKFGAFLKTAMAGHPVGSIERLHALGEAYIRFAFENDAYYRVIFSIQPKSKDCKSEIPEGGGFDLLREAVLQAIDAGTIRGPVDAAGIDSSPMAKGEFANLVSMYLWSLTHGIVTLTMCGAGDRSDCVGKDGAVQLLKAFAPFVNRGIREPDDRAGMNENDEERCHCE